jgi:hypothetical protein
MKLTTLAKAACVVAVVGLAGAASANTYPLTTTALGQPTLLNGDFGTIYGTESGSGLQTTDFFFSLGVAGSLGGDITSLDLTVAPGLNYSIVGLTSTLTDTTTSTTVGGGGSFDLFNLPTGNYELAVSGTPVGSAGGIFSGVISVDAVPLPSAVWLLLSGVLGVAAMTRRRVPAATRSV